MGEGPRSEMGGQIRPSHLYDFGGFSVPEQRKVWRRPGEWGPSGWRFSAVLVMISG